MHEEIIFSRAIEAFRSERTIDDIQNRHTSCIVYPFFMSEKIVCNGFIIHASKKLPNNNKYFYSIVETIYTGVTPYSSFCVDAIASILSFVTECDIIIHKRIEIINKELDLHPVLKWVLYSKLDLQADFQNYNATYVDGFDYLIKSLYDVEYGDYKIAMQFIRLYQLSLTNKKIDFGLSYTLMVAAIEALAKKEVTIEPDIPKNEINLLRKKYVDCPRVEKILGDYYVFQNIKGSRKKYEKFILQNSSMQEWQNIISNHPFEPISNETGKRDFFVGKEPINMSEAEIKTVISNSYTYRSNFIHEGKIETDGKAKHYFFNYVFNGFNSDGEIKESEQRILPTYELLKGIAKLCFKKWINKKHTH